MIQIAPATVTSPESTPAPSPGKRPLAWNLVRLARPHQWAKSVFVLIGPLYGWADLHKPWPQIAVPALLAAAIFGLVSSACYIVNDIVDAPRDRAHPRKKRRPIASGAVSPHLAAIFAAGLLAAAGALLFALPAQVQAWVGLAAGLYALNVVVYSFALKHVVMADVICLSLGFVLRVLGGCAAVGIGPTTWLLNCTLFLAMFLAFGKRLGERRLMLGAEGAVSTRGVQAAYTDDLLRMAVVVTAVASLLTYAGYVQAQEAHYHLGFNLLWLTILPATYGVLRCMVLVERGDYDDPTELATKDPPFQLAAGAFGVLTLALIVWVRH
jgi:decaprenyl-phosphate phosphoribosyltransferase